jgi:hypothetical protein
MSSGIEMASPKMGAQANEQLVSDGIFLPIQREVRTDSVRDDILHEVIEFA